MDKSTLRRVVENEIRCKEGNSFQDLCDRLCLKLHPNDYTPVRAGGPKGDMKNDGYCPKARIFFAAHATRGETLRRTQKKIQTDLEGCLRLHKNVKKWIYLTNDTLVGEIETLIDELRQKHPEVEIETWGHKKIAENMIKLSEKVICEIIQMPVQATLELEGEIENGVRLLEKRRCKEALTLLERLWLVHGGMMTPRQKYRTKANIGHAYLNLENFKRAADCFLEAKQHDPSNEEAGAREALAYVLLGNRPKAHQLACGLLSTYPELKLARTIWIKSAPARLSLEDVLKNVPKHQRDDPGVALALAETAISRGDHSKAEKYAVVADSGAAGTPRIKELLGDVMVQRSRLEEQMYSERNATPEEKECLVQACSLFTESLRMCREQDLTESRIRLRLKRAGVYVGLGEEEAEADVIFAYELDPKNVDAVFRYAGLRAKKGDLDTAISLSSGLRTKEAKPTLEFCIAGLLEQRNKSGDKDEALELLRSRVKDLGVEEPDFRIKYLSALSSIEREIAGYEKALDTLVSLPKHLISIEASMVLRAEVLRLEGRTGEAMKVAKQLMEILGENTTIEDKRRTAILLQTLGLHKAALELWKDIVKPEYVGRETYLLLECAHRCGDAKVAVAFSEKLRKNGIWDEQVFHMELNYRSEYNDDKGAKDAMIEFLEQRSDASYSPVIRTRLSLLGIRTGEKELVETNPEKLPAVLDVDPHIGRMVIEVLRHGKEPLRAVEYAYDLLRSNWNNAEAHLGMIGVFLPNGPKIELDEAECVIEGTAVRYKEDDTGVQHWHVVEDSTVEAPEASRNEFGTGHPVSQAMRGKKSGENFFLKKDDLQDRTATITRIINKYIYRFNDCIAELETRFPGEKSIRKFIATDKAGKLDTTPMDRLAERDAQIVERLEEMYSNGGCPLSFMAETKGRSMIETMNYVAGKPGLRLRCCGGTDEEEELAEQGIAQARSVVIDSSALATLLFTGSYSQIAEFPIKWIVSQGTLDELRKAEAFHGAPENSMISYSTDGPVRISSEEIAKAREAIEKLIDFVRSKCTVESGLLVAEIESDRRKEVVAIFGRPVVEAMMLAAQEGYVLWTDDALTGAFARSEFGCRRVWTQFVFQHFADSGQIEREVADALTVQLMGMEYYYTKPNDEAILRAVRDVKGDVDMPPLRQALDWFKDSNVKIQGACYLGARVLKKVWLEFPETTARLVTMRMLDMLSERSNGASVIDTLLRDVQNIFWIDVVNAGKAERVMKEWERTGGGTEIIVP